MAQTRQARTIDTVENEAQRVFKLQREAYLRQPYPSYEERLHHLRTIDRVLVDNRKEIAAAISADFGHRAAEESMIAELFTSVDGLRDAAKHLKKWMAPERRHVSALFATGHNRVVPMPKGVVGIVSPWNYPLFLTISPLTSALAAGNRAMIKMAANSQHLCRLLAEKVRAELPEEVVAILPGVRGQDFSALPYDHLIFTGSADAGRTVMRAAAENLTPVTLELGGKSPTIIAEDFDVDEAAARILYAKFLNAGQTCLAPTTCSSPSQARPVRRRRAGSSRSASRRGVEPVHVGDRRQGLPPAAGHARRRRRQGAELVSLVPGAQFDDAARSRRTWCWASPTRC
jgi:coniferyl-aldehyde dehydrogenase